MSAGVDRVTAAFARARAEDRAALVGYLTGFDPDRAGSRERIFAACEAGLDVLELGVPFSDPAADGPTIQAAMTRALASGASMAGSLALAAEIRQRFELPIVLFSYANPLVSFGPERLARETAEAGVDALLVVDMPPEHAEVLRGPASARGLGWIGLVAPTTTPARRARVLAASSGFVYAVSLTGVTGAPLDASDAGLHAGLATLRGASSLPIVVGFGVRKAEDVRALARHADGVVVGSALVEAGQRGPAALGELVAALRGGTRRV
ncbi:tryptophan synthase subunit alpha [Nannocystis bainbridge]|uniref:Tryptophan synthase alpha chain n=1 Tax=Nannocystis bainbridge TaxID=2995303 RepID=A0ABT5E2Z0_9BACT|nr:tryptophan synthase subunit alpha [Nannocystis bainbridge]MDC0720232.1 tryptophan synthase subunit alpha [Nannocystis bainbridge]